MTDTITLQRAEFEKIKVTLEENNQHHINYDEHGGYDGSDLQEKNLQAITIAFAALAQQAEPAKEELHGCACRWDADDNRVATCVRHQGWLDVVQEWSERAKAAEAQQVAQQAEQAGWVRVPVEPTKEMCIAARAVPEPVKPYPPHFHLIWDAMLAAAPKGGAL